MNEREREKKVFRQINLALKNIEEEENYEINQNKENRFVNICWINFFCLK